jgi:hypothetical protein
MLMFDPAIMGRQKIVQLGWFERRAIEQLIITAVVLMTHSLGERRT